MSDPNLKDFYVRLGRIEKIRRAGGGFEADGTLGLSYYTRAERRRIPLFRPMLVLFLCVVGLKGLILHQVGADTYAARVAALNEGGTVDQIGGFIMQADPITVFVADQIRDLMN